MPPPIFALGAYVKPLRNLRSPNLPDELDFKHDYSGHKTTAVGRIVKVPTLTESFTFSNWNEQQGVVLTTMSDVWVYDLEVFDLETQSVAVYRYAEAGLGSLAAESLGSASATHYDGDAPPPELSRLLAAERYAR